MDVISNATATAFANGAAVVPVETSTDVLAVLNNNSANGKAETPRKPRVLAAQPQQRESAEGKAADKPRAAKPRKATATASAGTIAAKRAHLSRWVMVRDGTREGSPTHTAALAEIAKREAELRKLGADPYAKAEKRNTVQQRIAALKAQIRDALPKSPFRAKLVEQLNKLVAEAAAA